MTMPIPVARIRITRQMNEAEQALNDALLKQALLFTTLVGARRDSAVDQFTGQDALMRLTKSQQSLLSAGGDLARVHGRLLEIGRETGQVLEDCPDDWRETGFKDESVAA